VEGSGRRALQPQDQAPFLTDPPSASHDLLVDRAPSRADLRRTGIATANFVNAPPASPRRTPSGVQPDKAAQILEAAGWKKGADGIRAKDGVKLKMVYQTSINARARRRKRS